ncbi:Holliday junction branch migration protein RuvA [Agarilytica rhodophyticola]|uniref:Holliday junction branch migration protein RuvA n=1 Tax=Agarilytica rhodophyticola TaxID=1737490 RepID=UPI000B342AF1|nr:Holliday junction branch migration protein RuvA [Agarilytica rhodophyticola]
MIGRLTGTLLEKQAPHLLIDVQGVGYELQSPMTTFYQLPAAGKQVVLHTHFSVSENSQQLFGFIGTQDRELFRLLIKVSGVGPKMAIGIMSMEANDFARCVMDDNVSALVKVPGVGKKTAERLIVEMRDKLKDWSIEKTPDSNESGIIKLDEPASNVNDMIAEAESALIALGYKPTEATKAVSKVKNGDVQRSEDLIRLALRGMLPA